MHTKGGAQAQFQPKKPDLKIVLALQAYQWDYHRLKQSQWNAGRCASVSVGALHTCDDYFRTVYSHKSHCGHK